MSMEAAACATDGAFSLDWLWSVDDQSFSAALAHVQQAGGVIFNAPIRVEAAPPFAFDPESGVAQIEIAGVMTKRAGFFQRLFGGMGTADIAGAVEAASADDSVRAILLNVDSPGGSVDGLAELADAVYAARGKKPVWAHVSGMAASAALLVASQASKIFAGRMDMIGSIGTRMMLFDFSRMAQNAGIRPVLIDTGKFKSIGAPGVEVTAEQEAHLRELVDQYFADFVGALVRGRNLPEAHIRSLADGRLFLATQAVEHKLIDGIQSKAETLAALAGSLGPRSSSPLRRVSPMSTTATPVAPEQPVAQPEPILAPVAATLAELKAAFPQSTADWRETQLLAGATIAAAKDAWIDHLQARMTAQETEHKTALEAAKQTAAPAVGVEPLKSKTGGDYEPGESGDAVADFEAAVSDAMTRYKIPRHKAHARVCRERPELREAMVAQHNAEHGQARKAK